MARLPPSDVEVAVTVASRDRPEALGDALAALVAHLPPGVPLLVVDSASADDRTMEVADAAGVRWIRTERPGLAVARNVAVEALDSEIVVFTDDDCRPRPGWVEGLVAPFEDPAVGFVTGPLVGVGAGTAADVVGLGEEQWRWPDDPLRMGSGANMALRRRGVLEAGGFDPRLGAGAPIPSGEEHDVFLRLLRLGWEGRHVPGAVVDHHDQRSRIETLRMCYRYGLGSGAVCALAGRTDPAVGRAMLRRRLWEHGLRGIVGDLRRRWEEPAARGAAFTAGVVPGWVRGRRLASEAVTSRGPDASGALDSRE